MSLTAIIAILFTAVNEVQQHPDDLGSPQYPQSLRKQPSQKKIKYLDAEAQAAILEKIPARQAIYSFLFATGCSETTGSGLHS